MVFCILNWFLFLTIFFQLKKEIRKGKYFLIFLFLFDADSIMTYRTFPVFLKLPSSQHFKYDLCYVNFQILSLEIRMGFWDDFPGFAEESL